MKGRNIVLATSLLALAGCASHPDKIEAVYVSPLKYKDYDCEQIQMELDSVSQRTARLYQSLEAEATADQVQMGIGLLLFWPALLALEGGDGPQATEYAQLKGEYRALHEAAVKEKCTIESKSPEQIVEEAKKKRDPEAKEG